MIGRRAYGIVDESCTSMPINQLKRYYICNGFNKFTDLSITRIGMESCSRKKSAVSINNDYDRCYGMRISCSSENGMVSSSIYRYRRVSI